VGLIGKELKNSLSETWVNYAMPVKDLTTFVAKAKSGEYKPIARPDERKIEDKRAFHGLVLVPDILDRTPPYIDEVLPDSPAARAGLKPDDLVVFIRLPRNDGSGEREERIISSVRVFKDTLAPLDPGTQLTLVVRRGTQLLGQDLTLEPPLKSAAAPVKP
jgi:serine protease Do